MAILPTRRELRGAVARGWCADANSHKEMDVELADAIVAEIVKLLKTKSEPDK